MSSFDVKRSEELDQEIITTFSSLLANQKLLKEREEKEEFLLKERKIIYDLLTQVNEERIVSFILIS